MAPEPETLSGKHCIVTGASSGIGLATAEALAARGAHVVLLGRNPERAEQALAGIRARTGSDRVEALLADFSSLAEVRRAAGELLEKQPRIDVLINNAGTIHLKRGVTVDGFERTFAVNHLAPFLLTHLLLERIRAAPAARVVNVASDAHKFGGPLDFDDLQSERRYRPMRVYGRSKLCNILFTRELARRLHDTPVTANCCHPGAVATRLGHDDAPGWVTKPVSLLLGLFFRTPEQGARTSVYLATSPDLEGVSGLYFADERERAPAAWACDAAAARRLWEVSERLTGLAS